ncbi:hypothetical protein [Deinococcus wulumuqiensis]|uniref:Uncharacterized protein n=1 Tax=Deinococcus wulumuqiensis TaxID=980427 RepID=A0AAV4K8B9_9DEIO|nr:hypothetical protein [Deinococcus wulumuqiensis]QII21199.1 hypothetical protein G6R31_10930 [Deinococcus wulumuqiensis R12]GGI83279.1 hypothetical protein GCM10010914_16900 [Deinococcus wulumuqiensis]GGP29674.1 hypothetical protein GCM10008021_13250 [Deinococcus wulumuqiensis]
MSSSKKLEVKDQSVQFHINLMQSTISRMANSSAACKTAAVAIVSLLVTLSPEDFRKDAILLAILPIISFASMDTYYLSLEKDLRSQYNEFVAKLHMGTLEEGELYRITARNTRFYKQIVSPSIYIYYGSMLIMSILARLTILK